jgi:hypothetical protein
MHNERKIRHCERKYIVMGNVEIVRKKILSVREMPTHVRVEGRTDGNKKNKKNAEYKKDVSGGEITVYIF